jgi:hypothetical protein
MTLLLAGIAPVQADVIKRACIDSGRTGANYALCGCIQGVANQTLSRAEQRKAASFFENPHRAQEVRQSDRNADERFWTRYRQFGSVAQNACG